MEGKRRRNKYRGHNNYYKAEKRAKYFFFFFQLLLFSRQNGCPLHCIHIHPSPTVVYFRCCFFRLTIFSRRNCCGRGGRGDLMLTLPVLVVVVDVPVIVWVGKKVSSLLQGGDSGIGMGLKRCVSCTIRSTTRYIGYQILILFHKHFFLMQVVRICEQLHTIVREYAFYGLQQVRLCFLKRNISGKFYFSYGEALFCILWAFVVSSALLLQYEYSTQDAPFFQCRNFILRAYCRETERGTAQKVLPISPGTEKGYYFQLW